MKGAPWLEGAVVAAASILLVVPLMWLTGEREARPRAEAVEASGDRLEAWVDFRFSHAPLRARLLQEDVELWQGGGDFRDDADVELRVRERRAELRLEVTWPDEVEQAYAEAVVEAGAYPAVHRGGWGDGESTFVWRIEWEEAP